MSRPLRAGLIVITCLVLWPRWVSAQSLRTWAIAKSPKYEMRGAWVATHYNLDWPSSGTLSPTAQRQELRRLLDLLKDAGVNAVFLQVRSECDAVYPSSIDPWSYRLTGMQGRAPSPFYDPLEFAIEEAHRRGIELHAWINPFRAEALVGAYSLDPSHVAVLHPDWVITLGTYRFLDPGIPEVRDYVTSVVGDVVSRYDVDGVQFDDYFYDGAISTFPPQNAPDYGTFLTHGGSFTSIYAWRRDNINSLMVQVYDRIQSEDAAVVFGVSPPGIWRNGVPTGTTGRSAYDEIYADAPQWLRDESVDYIAPQLYWAFGGGQDYALLAPWWLSQSNGRHVYTGHAVYKNDLFGPHMIPDQIRFNRTNGLQGGLFFRTEHLVEQNLQGIADTLASDLFRYPALTPVMGWRDLVAPASIDDLTVDWTGTDEITLSWSRPASSGFSAEARLFAVYRVRSAVVPDFGAVISDPTNLAMVTGDTTIVDRPGVGSEPYYYVVTGVSANSVEGIVSDYVVVDGRAVHVEVESSPAFVLEQNYPNPFRSSTRIRFGVRQVSIVSLQVFDSIGRRVARLISSEQIAPGVVDAVWEGRDDSGRAVASGTYFAVLDADGQRRTIGMVFIR